MKVSSLETREENEMAGIRAMNEGCISPEVLEATNLSQQKCTCKHQNDTCPSCYGRNKIQLSMWLYEAQLLLVKRQQQMMDLETSYTDHLSSLA